LKRLLVALLFVAAAAHADARRVEAVTFESLDHDAAGPVTLRGILLLPPRAAPPGGFPAIVALHGCGGMYATRAGREGELAERLALRADPWLRDGYAVLFPDSFGARGAREICTVHHGERTITAARRRLDALGALAYLASRADIARERIALVGWSHGGSAALQAANAEDAVVAQFLDQPNPLPFFRAVVAYYPGCAAPLRASDHYKPAAPTRIHIGELDDWTPASTCVALGAAMARRGGDLLVTTYPGSYHAFDSPAGTVVQRLDVPNGVHPGEGVHVGPNPAARKAANASVRAFLRERLRRDDIEGQR
jgi:dienelactone hydrolase